MIFITNTLNNVRATTYSKTHRTSVRGANDGVVGGGLLERGEVISSAINHPDLGFTAEIARGRAGEEEAVVCVPLLIARLWVEMTARLIGEEKTKVFQEIRLRTNQIQLCIGHLKIWPRCNLRL